MFEIIRVRVTVFVRRFFDGDTVRGSVFGVKKFFFEFTFPHFTNITPGNTVFVDELVEMWGVGPRDRVSFGVRFGARAGNWYQARNIQGNVNRQWIRIRCGSEPTSVKNVRC